MNSDHPTPGKPARLSPKPSRSIGQMILGANSLVSGGMLFVAMVGLLGADDLSAYVKVGLLALGGAIVSYGVDRFALDRGAPLAVVGYTSAGITSILSIGFVGCGLFAATYAGLTIRDVERLRLDAHGVALADYVTLRGADLTQGAAIAPLLTSIAADIEQKSSCERSASCISARPAGGRGPVARTLEAMAERAKSVVGQIDAGVSAAAEKTAQIGALQARYTAISAGTEPLADKRVKLQAIDGQIRHALAARKAAFPLGLVAAYAGELQSAAAIPGQPEASRAVSAILQGHAQSLRGSGDATSSDPIVPAFPKAAGVTDTFAYAGHFAPVAAITAVVELVFPLVLWIYVALTLAWEMHQREPKTRRQPHEDDLVTRRIIGEPTLLPRVAPAADLDPEMYFRKPPAGRLPNGDDRPGRH